MRNDPPTREGTPREQQVDGIRPLFSTERGGKRVDDRKVLSGIIPVIQKGLRRVHAPAAAGPHKTLYDRCRRWRDKGVFELIFSGLSASNAPGPEVLMLDATDVKALPWRPASTKGCVPRLVGGIKGAWPASSMGSATAKVVPCDSTCVRGNAVTSPVPMWCAKTCHLWQR